MTFKEFLKQFPDGKAVIDHFIKVRYEKLLLLKTVRL